MKTISNDKYFFKLGRNVVYRIMTDHDGDYVMSVIKKDNFFGRKNVRGGRASVLIYKNEFKELTGRDKVKIFQKLYLDALYETDDESTVFNSFELTSDFIRLYWLETDVIVEFARDRSTA